METLERLRHERAITAHRDRRRGVAALQSMIDLGKELAAANGWEATLAAARREQLTIEEACRCIRLFEADREGLFVLDEIPTLEQAEIIAGVRGIDGELLPRYVTASRRRHGAGTAGGRLTQGGGA